MKSKNKITLVEKLEEKGIIKQSDVIYSTTDLSIFKFMGSGNRKLYDEHVKQIKDRISNIYLKTIIIVNKNMEIIDGQHRFAAVSQLNKDRDEKGLPPLFIEFLIVPDYGKLECSEYNGKNKTWNNQEIANACEGLGIKEYIIYSKFKEKFNFSHNVVLGLFSNNPSNSKNFSAIFKNRKLTIDNLKLSMINAYKILDIVETGVIPIGKNDQPISIFLLGLIKIFNQDNYDHKRMVSKCMEYEEENRRPLRKTTNTTEVKLIFEEIYNKGEKIKIDFVSLKEKNKFTKKFLKKYNH